jgi:predicted kinase
MNLVIFVGIQATGKSTFYRERFFRTHVRVNFDMLKTRRREELLFKACLAGGARVVVDNTNLTRGDRARYMAPAKEAGFTIHGYFFQSRAADALVRNSSRREDERVPDLAIRGASRRLELPARSEGFRELYFVRMDEVQRFTVEEWQDEI